MSSSNPRLLPDSLAFSLHGAAQAIAAVGDGVALPQALARIWSKTSASPQARGAIQDLSYHCMRNMGRAEALLHAMTTKQTEPAVLHGLICCALGLLSDPDEQGDNPRYNTFTLVDQAVNAAAADPEMAHAKGMVNAVLRRFLRERDALMKSAAGTQMARFNYPNWWIDRMRSAYPQDWEAILEAGNQAPPLTLRVNRRKTSLDNYLARLSAQGLTASQIGPDAIRLAQATPVSQIPGFEEGWVSVQDAGAQRAADLIDVQDGMRVLDACAAPGGKTGHILERADVDLLALDHDPLRLKRIEENLHRLQLSANLMTGDAGKTDWWDGQPFDRILADVPCTASGIVRRHPDIRWLRRKTDTTQLATISAGILDNLWQMLKPNGKLLFVTCSLWPQESEAQAASFVARHADAVRQQAPGQLLPSATADRDHDGLFYALFHKQAT
ncbi:MAG: 16S rRNA (cytosine(967)-C(5))-methyltransferase RsmB [Oxalicibacterium faecigallinarum]|uniref:16S rRNA (cytosine(967)-C(5))-methyltransferase RsmB n=1 Tax=Oxalicibacterium faecigallinarum TaxID=573741 RepID=UPI002809E0EC|nr:16S rRNA (cytosine(967)-C(5))-methyltransferase RsmB [Oxalicibacterium faecigallinarum]MDQ7968972.1 16S rRNA (cytosine(967)-C(5))-methyltransferase RsmB [Oxalicibacterium faecigallinarum]